MFSFFRSHTARVVPGCFYSSLWNCHVLQLTHYEPAILHAAIAVGAMHRVSRGNSPTLQALYSHGGQPDRQQSFALAQYVKALKCLREVLDKRKHDINNKTVVVITLVACLLFMCLETLQGNRAGSIQHLKTGLRVLTECQDKNLEADSERETAILFVKSDQHNSTILDTLTSVFGRLDYEATMFDKRAPLLQVRPSEGCDEIPQEFFSVTQARQYLDQLASDIFRFRAELLQRASFVSSLEIDGDRDWVREYVAQNIASRKLLHCEGNNVLLAELRRLQNCLTLWLSAFRFFTAFSEQEMGLRRTLQLLEIQHFYIFFIAQTYADRTESDCDRFIPLFRHILELAESFVQSIGSNGDETNTIAFTLESGIAPSLFLITLKCRDSELRCRALHLLKENSCQEGMWEGALMARFMKEVIDLEESYAIAIGTYSGDHNFKAEDIPEHSRFSDVAVMGCDGLPGWGRVVGGVYVGDGENATDPPRIVLRERIFVI